MICIALTGRDGGEIVSVLSGDDVNICVQSTSTARIQEVHGMMYYFFKAGIIHLVRLNEAGEVDGAKITGFIGE